MKRVIVASIVAGLCGIGGAAANAQQAPPPAPPAPDPSPVQGRGAGPGQVTTGPERRRLTPPQPRQKQGPEYLEGAWTFTWTGRESPVTPGPRAGTITFTRQGGGSQVLEIRVEGKAEETGTPFTESGTAAWDEAQQSLAFRERLADGTQLTGTGHWSSPLAIRYESEPVTIGGQAIRVRRTYQILSAHSFMTTDEMSVNEGPFVRLGNGLYSKVPP